MAAAKKPPKVEDDSLRGPIILAKIITDALQRKEEGQPADYNTIVEQLSAPDIKPVMVRRWLKGLRYCVSHFTKECSTLVAATLNLPWAGQEARLVEDYIIYLSDLVSAQTSYLKSCLVMLVKHFHRISNDCDLYLNVHHCMKTVCELVPNSPAVLMSVIVEQYPFKYRPASQQEVYMRNLLVVVDYLPSLRDGVLQLIVNQMMKIDVEVPHLEEEEASDSEEDDKTHNNGEVFQCDMECSTGDINGGNMLSTFHYRSQQMSNEMADKLDVMMLVMYEYLHRITHNIDGTTNKKTLLEVFHVLLNIFESSVLSTHQSSHVQFVLFQLSSHDQVLQDLFLDYLWNKFTNMSVPDVLRQTAVSYMASYIARALFIPARTVKHSLSTLTTWMHDYIGSCSSGKLKAEYCLHAPFYSACQAAFYMFIFRHQELLQFEGGLEFLLRQNFERIVMCPLNPLKMCLNSVAELFASVTNQLELVFCYTVLEQNKRLLLLPSQTSQPLNTSDNVTTNHPLDTFFPFDPYQLCRSNKFIRPLYRFWEGFQDSEQISNMDEDNTPVTPSSLCSSSVQSPRSPGFGTTPDSNNSSLLTQQKR
ncbi:RNA polymerase I-specific transcription initiation factor RRN3-like isoform X2 [Dysidea avara]|uniref:RNA polymerase I-specific transcription initiation factor RRN3-like isoform X2 n=1 Tax=Dysidea avara TaxID=196820 RepID=UPI00332194B8